LIALQFEHVAFSSRSRPCGGGVRFGAVALLFIWRRRPKIEKRASARHTPNVRSFRRVTSDVASWLGRLGPGFLEWIRVGTCRPTGISR